MYDQPLPQSIVYYMLYASVTMMAIIASCYLLLRRGNAFAPDNTPPLRLRRWMAALFASIALANLWYLPVAFLVSSDDIKLNFLGTNRTYLANYFTSQGITYNTYIKNLRIKHFISLYKQAVASQRVFTIQQLASESGFRNYSTFSTTFKRIMGQNVSEWMCDNA